MEGPDREKIAVVLVYKYKEILDDIKRDFNTPEMLVRGQVIELELMGLTESTPIARSFLNRVIEYRRDRMGTVKEIAVPVIEGASEPEKQSKQESVVEATIKSEPAKKSETKESGEGYPFEF